MTDPPSAVLVHLSVTNVLVFDQQQYQRILITYNGNFQGNFRKLHVLRPRGHALFTATVSSTLATNAAGQNRNMYICLYCDPTNLIIQLSNYIHRISYPPAWGLCKHKM